MTDTDPAPAARGSVFERHPVLTMGALLTLLVLAVCIGAEWLLALREGDEAALRAGVSEDATALVERHIRLRERRPLTTWKNVPTPDYLAGADDLPPGPYWIRTDAEGFIEPSRVHEDPDLTVVFLGGSTTECAFLPEEARWPYLAGRELEALSGSLRVNSFNAGKSGNHSMHSNDLLLNKVLPMAPDAVALMHAVNDLSVLLHEGSYWNDNPTRSLILTRPDPDRVHLAPLSSQILSLGMVVKEHTFPRLYERISAIGPLRAALKALYRRGTVQGRIVERRGRETDAWDEVPALETARIVAAFERSLETFVEVARAWGTTPVLMTQANRFTPDLPRDGSAAGRAALERFDGDLERYAAFRATALRMNDAVRAVARRNQVALVDLAEAVPASPSHLYDTVHYNEAGSRLAARVVAETLWAELSAGR